MPHQCVRCKANYEDGSSVVLNGCSCGSKYFFFFRESDLNEKIKNLTASQIVELEEDIDEIIGEVDEGRPVMLDFESIRVTEPGKFEIDLVNLMNKEKPLVYRLSEGKYVIDIGESFRRNKEAKHFEPKVRNALQTLKKSEMEEKQTE